MFTLSIPFSKAFDVPIFKPSFSLSNPKFNIPSQETIKDSLKNAGVSVLKIPQMLTAFSSGNGLKDVLKQIDINFEFTFNLEVKNSGSAPWEFILDDCALQCEDGSLIYAVAKNSNILSM